MNKQKLLDLLLEELTANLKSLVDAAFVAKEAATSEESKAENKYDTRGLEASYLAGAQAKRAEELKAAVYKIQKINLRNFNKDEGIGLTAIVQVVIDGGEGKNDQEKIFFLLPSAGGQKITFDGLIYHVITPESPVGSLFLGKKINDSFQVTLNQKKFDYEITNIN